MNDSGVSSTTDIEMPTTREAATKRKTDNPEEDQPPAKKQAPSIRVDGGFKWNLQALAKAADAVGSGGKSPVSALNELGLKVHYSITRQGGPAHCPNFTVSVTVANMTFEGSGHSKRDARASAARACLTALLARAGRVLPAPGPPPDFTSDEPPRCQIADFQSYEMKVVRPPEVTKISPTPNIFGQSVVQPLSKSPINTLYEQYPGLTFQFTFGDGSPLDSLQAPPQLSHSMRFKVLCQIKDKIYEGYGSSKKLAKLAAARAALGELYERAPPVAPHALAETLPQLVADHIAKLVNEKFNELMRGDLVHSRRKVLAGVVLTRHLDTDTAQVIAVATGTKCVSGEHISVRGQAVNDGHAEVVARRCLQRFLYSQLLMYAQSEDPTKMIPESELEPVAGGGFQLKEDRRVHLYVSTAPCGDGRIFSPHENYGPEPDRHPNRMARGQLRTKIESGEGTIPVKNSTNVVQTWDGLLQGERLLTMSCSDKMARWCVVGLQGALLGRLMRPVYLHSLVLGSLLHHHHMYRALCGRVESHISSLPPPYQLQRPRLARAASMEARTPARAPCFSVCWAVTSPSPEVINATTGKLESGHPSMVCKQSMFARWQYLVKRLPLLPQHEDGSPPPRLPQDLDHMLYNEAKLLCSPYQEAKDCLINAFDRAQLGRWIKKPIEQDQFQCEILDADPAALFAWAGSGHGGNAMQITASSPVENAKNCTKIHGIAPKNDKITTLALKTDVKYVTKNENFTTKNYNIKGLAHKTDFNGTKNDDLAPKDDKITNCDFKANINGNKIDYVAPKIDNITNVAFKANVNGNKIEDVAPKNYNNKNLALKTNLNGCKNDDLATNNFNVSTAAFKNSGTNVKIDRKDNILLNTKTNALRRPKSVAENDYFTFEKYESNININNSQSNRLNYSTTKVNRDMKEASLDNNNNSKPRILDAKQSIKSNINSRLKIDVGPLDTDFTGNSLNLVENRNTEMVGNRNRETNAKTVGRNSLNVVGNRNGEIDGNRNWGQFKNENSNSAIDVRKTNMETNVSNDRRNSINVGNRNCGQYFNENSNSGVHVGNRNRKTNDSSDVVQNRNRLNENRIREGEKSTSSFLERRLAAYRNSQKFLRPY